MGVTEQLKKLHKQKMIKTSDIPRVVNSGVDVDTYLNRARTLDSYINGNEDATKVDFKETVDFKEKVKFSAKTKK